MAEKTKQIDVKDYRRGVYIELECCMCSNYSNGHSLSSIGNPIILAADNQKELKALIKEQGWKELHSDEYALIGYWCGCDYKD